MPRTPPNAAADLGVRSPSAVAERPIAAVLLLRDPAATEADVTRLFTEHGEIEPVAVSADDLADLRSVTAALDELFASTDVDSWAAGLNGLLARWASAPRLAHEGVGWHLHVDRGDDASLAEWFASSSSLALAVLLTQHAEPPVGRCAAEGCGRPFLQTWSGSPRRFCSPACATRTRVAAHRRRRAIPDEDRRGAGP